MKRFFNFILSHSIFIAFCASALSLQTLQLLSLPVNVFLLAIIFFAALAGYNAYWILSSYSYSKPITAATFLKKRSSSFIVLLVAVAGVIFCFTRLHLFLYNFIITSILLAFYSLPVMPVSKLQSLLKTGVFKTIILALAWTIITTMVPLQISILAMGPAAMLIFISRFFFMLMLCIIFDKRDAAVDKLRGLQSLATQIKPVVIHYLIAMLFAGYTILCCAMKWHGIGLWQVAALILAGITALLVYVISLKNQGYIFYYFLVDGLMFWSALLTFLVS